MVQKAHRGLRLSKPWFPPETIKGLKRTLDSGWVASGEKAELFGRKVAAVEGYRYGVATNSCTSALQVALEIYPFMDQKVRIPSITYPATANAVLAAGHVPFITNCRHDLGVDLFGLKTFHRTWEIVDSACSLGSNRKADNPQIACYSFHARKVISTGEGGCLCTDNKAMADRAAELVSHGGSGFGYGYNMRMSDIQASIGLDQLNNLKYTIDKRRLIASWYNEYLPGDVAVYGQEDREVNGDYNYQCFVTILDTPAGRIPGVIEALRKRGVESNFGTYRLNKIPAYKDYLDPYADFEDPSYLALPIYYELQREDVEKVCSALGDSIHKTT